MRLARTPVGRQRHDPVSVLDLNAKGTVRNKELLSRAQYQRLSDVDLASFLETVDQGQHFELSTLTLFANLLADLAYSFVDPRIRVGRRRR